MLYQISCKYIVIINSTYKYCKVSKNTTLYTLFLYFYPMMNETNLPHTVGNKQQLNSLVSNAPPYSLCMCRHPPLHIARHCTQSIKPTYLMTTVGGNTSACAQDGPPAVPKTDMGVRLMHNLSITCLSIG